MSLDIIGKMRITGGDMKYIIVSTTCKDEKEATDIASELVKSKLAACVQMEPIKSFYMWKEKVCIDDEVRVFIKTKSNRYAQVKKMIKEMHSYELPQIVYTPIDGSNEFLSWIDEALN